MNELDLMHRVSVANGLTQNEIKTFKCRYCAAEALTLKGLRRHQREDCRELRKHQRPTD